jgi:alpha-ketoglutarate-dependent taurine dioxygenase
MHNAVNVASSTFDGLDLPLVLEPTARPTLEDTVAWVSGNRQDLVDKLVTHGALLFRGFPLRDAADMERLTTLFGGQSVGYTAGTTPRSQVRGNIYTSADVVRTHKIQLHSELAYQVYHPDILFFFCELPSRTGGETILADTRNIRSRIPSQLLDSFREKQVKYVRAYQDARRPLRELVKTRLKLYQHLTWQHAFATDSAAKAEASCRDRKIEFAWRKNGDLVVGNVMPALTRHPVSGEELWFNNIAALHYNRRGLGFRAYWRRKVLYRRKLERLPTHVYYGDGSPITPADMDAIYDAMDVATVAFPWTAGDLLLVDNRLVAHGRNPYEGNRRVLVSMASSFYSTAP